MIVREAVGGYGVLGRSREGVLRGSSPTLNYHMLSEGKWLGW